MVHLVDDDPGIRKSLAWTFQSVGMEFKAFATPEEFLAEWEGNVPGALILDLQLVGTSGLSLLKRLRQDGDFRYPVIIVTGTGDVVSAVQSMKLNVIDYLQKPVDPTELIELVRGAIADYAQQIERKAKMSQLRQRFNALTIRERELIPLICSGLSNKQIANQLKLSIKTVINHRASLLGKVQASNTADLVRLATASESLV